MLLGVIADDFTGASDIANTLVKEGMKVTQYVGVPSQQSLETCECGVVSLKSRTIPAQEAIKQSLEALEWLLQQGCVQIVFKYCSTFDSTAEGNIGPVAEALLARLGETKTVFCPAFPENNRSIYQGHLFVGDVLLNASGMENHPLTPMKNADLRAVLHAQSRLKVGHIAYKTIAKGAIDIKKALKENEASLFILDAITNQDLREIGKAVKEFKLITGGSGIAIGLPANFNIQPKSPPFMPIKGAGFVISGSCSLASQKQVEIYAQTHPSLLLKAENMMSGEMSVAKAVAFLSENINASPLLYSTLSPNEVKKAQETYEKDVIAQKFEHFFGEVASVMVLRGVKRIVVGGGETSGAVVQALNVKSFEIGVEIAAGVPALTTEKGLKIALKSGNFGQDDFYERALKILGSNA
jgi:3-dehydrotetronate 4-kinase